MVLGILYFIGFVKNSKAYKAFTLYLLCIGLIQVVSYFYGRGWLRESNLFLSSYYFISQFILLSLFYYYLLKKSSIKYILYSVLGLLCIQYFVQPNVFVEYNPIGITVTQIILVIYSVYYFYISLSGKRDFIISNIAIFFYLLSSTLIFASGNLVLDLEISKTTRFILINVNRVLIVLFQGMVLVDWFRLRK